ncbi:hypothetical protein [Streptomyces sp. AP-93]|uniref:hypothetical protein n=1 Tax=Streptomyces sp. AP-93 TaxID=2929048 RepID=UPI001FAF44C7|nr:hypothetical protein [Streptomyces sp. AP-93]MCJ0868373.1 hypothetical protein [Streptomyces sp. AP-93]
MNLRRILATLAATTVVAPAVLMSAPAAVAQPAAAGATATPTPADSFPTCTTWTQTPRTTTELLGFPTRLVAGTWSTFTFRTVNISASPLAAIGANADTTAWLEGTNSPRIKITTQWYDKAAKKWRPMPTSPAEFATVARALKPGARSDVKMRVMADRRSKAGDGFTFDYGRFAGKDGVCGHAATIHEYNFVVVPAAPTPKPTPTPKPATR